MVSDPAKAYKVSDDKDNSRPESKIHKKRFGGIRTPEFVVDVVTKNIRKIAMEMGSSRRTIVRVFMCSRGANYYNTNRFMSPTASPNCNPLDYFV